MLASLLPLCLLPLCLLLGLTKVLALRPTDYDNTVITTISHVELEALTDERNYYLDDQQCTGYISPGELCNDLQPLGVLVRMSDSLAPPLVEISSSLREAHVARIPDDSGRCNGMANVEVKLRCDGPLPRPHESGVRSRLASA